MDIIDIDNVVDMDMVLWIFLDDFEIDDAAAGSSACSELFVKFWPVVCDVTSVHRRKTCSQSLNSSYFI
jgi:hypothetical protein